MRRSLVRLLVVGALVVVGCRSGAGVVRGRALSTSSSVTTLTDPCPGLLEGLEAALEAPPTGPEWSPEALWALRSANGAGCDVAQFRMLIYVYERRVARLVPVVIVPVDPIQPSGGGGSSGSGGAADGPAPSAGGAAGCRSDAQVVLSGRLTDDIDGDSFEISGIEVRLSLVNTPEWDEAGGSEATRFTVGWFGSAIVDVYRPSKAPRTDHYGRQLGDVVRRSDCSSLAVELVREGLGEPMDAYCHEDPGLARRVGC